MNRIRGIALSVALVLFALMLALFSVAYDANYYSDFQESHDIVAVTGKSAEELERINADTIRYLKIGEPELMRHYSNRAATHMVDVYHLFNLARAVTLVSGAVAAVLLFQEFRQRAPGAFGAAMLTQGLLCLILVVVVVCAMTNWDALFTGFHELFFSNDLWLLDPRTDLMIQMMPTPFFVGMAARIGVRAVVMVLVVDGLWLVKRRLERRANAVGGQKNV
ncbi:MAG: TIGR01906 family membrane protein [Peptoniphilaceae bacterium]|nr:TIGR01906 family membrane protein [Peptoniphilaceae bacterium]MDY6085622.1 TIGR01906 family membrane protein [Peptoniphilaceae bacterium]